MTRREDKTWKVVGGSAVVIGLVAAALIASQLFGVE
jgi:hypothetical protein